MNDDYSRLADAFTDVRRMCDSLFPNETEAIDRGIRFMTAVLKNPWCRYTQAFSEEIISIVI